MSTPTPDDLRKLAGIMELACRSNFDDERLAALGLARHWFDTRKLRWGELLTGTVAHAPPPPPPLRGWRTVVEDLQRYQVNEWEAKFLDSITRWSGLTEKQANVLRKMCQKFGVAPWAETTA
jgi:hypothetical protein